MVMLGVTTKPTPLFNTKELQKVFALPFALDGRCLLNELETILYPYVTVTVKGEGDVVQVTTDDYFSDIPLYTHRTFLDQTGQTKEKKRERPTKTAMVTTLQNFPKVPYIWGGTFPQGVIDLFNIYKPKRELTSWEWHLHHLRGIDCSGLLYNVTHGTVPRNTGPLWKSCNPINMVEKPLDLIFTRDHVMIYMGGDKVIESRQYIGTVTSPITPRLKSFERDGEWIKYGRLH